MDALSNFHSPLHGGGTMGALIQAHAWSRTPLGSIEGWPQPLTGAVGIMLGTQHPAMVYWGEEHVCLYNDGLIPSLGVEKHPAILGLPAEAAFPDIWHILGPQIEQVMESGQGTWDEDRLFVLSRHGRTEETYWTYSLSPIHDGRAANGIGGVIAICMETTRAVRAEREREGRFRALMEASAQVFYSMSPDWTEMRQLSGGGFLLDSEGGDVHWIDKYIPPEDHDHLRVIIDRAIAAKAVFEFEHRVIQADGTLGWVLSRAVPMLAADGGIVEWFGAASDVTERKQAEQALLQWQHDFIELADAMPQLVWSTTPDGVPDYFNRRVKDYGGLVQAGDGRWLISGFNHPDDERARQIWGYAIASGVPYEIEQRLLLADGNYRWHISRGVPVRDDAGRIIRWYGTSTDIHALKTAERASLSKSQFLAAASHDLRQPMQSMFLFVSALIEHVRPEGMKAFTMLNQSMETMKLLLDCLLDLSRIDSGKIGIRMATFPLSDHLRQIAEHYQPVAGMKGLSMVVEDVDGLSAYTDPGLLGRILRNLVENALRYTDAGWVAISCR